MSCALIPPRLPNYSLFQPPWALSNQQKSNSQMDTPAPSASRFRPCLLGESLHRAHLPRPHRALGG